MIPLCDMHCHLLAGLDDGPATEEVALAMCRIAQENGVQVAAAGAHQNDHYPEVTPERIRDSSRRLAQRLREEGLSITVFPCAEVMVKPGIVAAWERGELLSVADRGHYLLVEMPHNLFVDLRGIVQNLRQAGVRAILAHPERHPELLHEPGQIEQLIQAGCLVQVSSASVTHPRTREDARALKDWFKRGVVHLLGSDGHSLRRRPPLVAEAYQRVVEWAGVAVADRVASTNGMAIAHGLPLQVPAPQPKRGGWIPTWW